MLYQHLLPQYRWYISQTLRLNIIETLRFVAKDRWLEALLTPIDSQRKQLIRQLLLLNTRQNLTVRQQRRDDMQRHQRTLRDDQELADGIEYQVADRTPINN